MPTKEFGTGSLFFGVENENGEFQKLEQITPCTLEFGMIEASDLDNSKTTFIQGRQDKQEISFDVDVKAFSAVQESMKPKHGEKVLIEVSCVCDSTLAFLIDLIYKLKKIGCTNIKTRMEDVENPEPKWMSTRFVATGIMWNTNNWRKMHGLPMYRRMRK